MKKILWIIIYLFSLTAVFAQKGEIITKSKKGLLELNGKIIKGTSAQISIPFEKINSGPYDREDHELIIITFANGSKEVFFHIPDNTWKFVTATTLIETGESYTLSAKSRIRREGNKIYLAFTNDKTLEYLTFGDPLVIK